VFKKVIGYILKRR